MTKGGLTKKKEYPDWITDLINDKEIPKYIGGGQNRTKDGYISQSQKRNRKRECNRKQDEEGTAEWYLKHKVFTDGLTPEKLQTLRQQFKPIDPLMEKKISVVIGDKTFELIEKTKGRKMTQQEQISDVINYFMKKYPEYQVPPMTLPCNDIEDFKYRQEWTLNFMGIVKWRQPEMYDYLLGKLMKCQGVPFAESNKGEIFDIINCGSPDCPAQRRLNKLV